MQLYFKQVYTVNTVYYEVDTTWTTLELYNNVLPLITRDFNIENFELLDTITSFDGKPEEKPKIVLDNISLDELYGNQIRYLAIYIRLL